MFDCRHPLNSELMNYKLGVGTAQQGQCVIYSAPLDLDFQQIGVELTNRELVDTTCSIGVSVAYLTEMYR